MVGLGGGGGFINFWLRWMVRWLLVYFFGVIVDLLVFGDDVIFEGVEFWFCFLKSKG